MSVSKVVPLANYSFDKRYVSVKVLCPSVFNPAERVTEHSLKALIVSVRKHGVMSPIHVLECNNQVIDGHRRLAAAIAVGLEHVPVIYHQGTPEDVPSKWAELCKTNRGTRAFEWMCFYHASKCKKSELPKGVSYSLTICEEIFGDGALEYLIKRQTSPTIGRMILQVYGRFSGSSKKIIPTKKALGHWIIDNGQQTVMKMFVQLPTIPDEVFRRLIRAVDNNVRLEAYEIVTTRRAK